MTVSDVKVQEALNLVEPLVQATQGFLYDSGDKEDKQKAQELILAWSLIVNQCEIASDARNMLSMMSSIQETDAAV